MTDPAPRDRLAGRVPPSGGSPFFPKKGDGKKGQRGGFRSSPSLESPLLKTINQGTPMGRTGPLGRGGARKRGEGWPSGRPETKRTLRRRRPPIGDTPPGPCSRAGAHPGKLAVPPGVPRIELGGVPVPLAEAVTAGAAPPTKRKDERRRLPFACAPCQGPRKSPFFFGIQNRFFFKGEKEMGLAPGGRCPPRWGSVTARLKGDFLFRRPAHQVI